MSLRTGGRHLAINGWIDRWKGGWNLPAGAQKQLPEVLHDQISWQYSPPESAKLIDLKGADVMKLTSAPPFGPFIGETGYRTVFYVHEYLSCLH